MIAKNEIKELVERGERRRDAGMNAAAATRFDVIALGQLCFLESLLNSPDGTATIDSATDDLAAKFGDGGKWRGTVTRSLSMAKITEAVGATKSLRPARRRGLLTVWRIADRTAAESLAARLRGVFSPNEKSPMAATTGPETNDPSNQQGIKSNGQVI